MYLNYVGIFLRNIWEHVKHIKRVMELILTNALKLETLQCEVAKKSVSLSGHVVCRCVVQVDDLKLSVIKDISLTKNWTRLCSFSNVARCYQGFMKGFVFIAAPLHELTLSEREYICTEEARGIFAELKQEMVAPPVVAFSDVYKPLVIETDTPDATVNAFLRQRDANNKIKPIYHPSRTMSATKRSYTACERKVLVVISAL